MKKILLQIILLVALFFGTWLLLSQINWMRIFRVEKFHKDTEEKLGDIFWDIFSKSEETLHGDNITKPMDSILYKICTANGIDTAGIKIHVIQKDEINAFALPNKHLVVFSGLITACEDEAELSGVMSHELAHIEMKHVMKRLIKEVGLSMLISMTTGKGGSESINKAAKILTSTAYDRNLEKEADIKAVEYLKNANIDPEYLATFLYRLSEKEPTGAKNLSWLSTHPDTKARAEYIVQECNGKKMKNIHVLSGSTWETLQNSIKE